ncbi:hypothetical protein [Streptomyces sp. Tu102]|uniref:hypothetical protein n=1 Tax=Streptomyces sp. Tu102 TaxID=2838019 RepID=UPI001BDD3161|nr:hypothetical protein [Streptomyces sp. Tu102]MBT1090324.1 hypothetical protein [Streptomyces sp. Tu102]
MDPLSDPQAQDPGVLERPLFFDGQQLHAEDLQGLQAHHRALRWLHNRSLHQPGVGNGLAVSGARGDREVRVQPGYALDAAGRELILGDPLHEPVPPVAGEPGGGPVRFDLTLAYPSDDDLEETETQEGVCAPRGAVRLRERPVLRWVRLRSDGAGGLRPVDDSQRLALQEGRIIALARAEVLGCRLNADIAAVLRRNARPPQRPGIVCGSAKVTWVPWFSGRDREDLIGLAARVDTTSGGLRATPCYTARIEGHRPLSVDVGREVGELLLLDGPAYVEESAPDGFVCRIPLRSLSGEGFAGWADPVARAAGDAFGVVWFAVEE